jgi:hypothetical protein
MKIHMTKMLRFWVEVEYQGIKKHCPGRPRTELNAQILRKFEEAGDAMRFVNSDGRIAWKATPGTFEADRCRTGGHRRYGRLPLMPRATCGKRGYLKRCNCTQIGHFNQDLRHEKSFPIHRQPCARTCNGCETLGTTARPSETATPSMGT